MKKMKKWIVMLLMASLHIGASAADTSDVRSVTQISSDCSKGIALEGCLGAPAPRPCPSGYHWSLAGSGIAHCVMDDPVCPPDEELIHDAQGNPSCVAKPKCANGGNDFPICTKPTCSNGGTDYPTCTDPVTPTCPNGATDFPVCTQPVCPNGGSDYPKCTNPVTPTCTNGGTDYPVCTQPVCQNGASDYPTCSDPTPKCTNGASDYPLCTPLVCANGASDYPTCTDPVTPKCANGASDYPTCTPQCPNGTTWDGLTCVANPPPQDVCQNGASNFPTCTFPPPQDVCKNGASNFPTCTFPPPVSVQRTLICLPTGWPKASNEVADYGEIFDWKTNYVNGSNLSDWHFNMNSCDEWGFNCVAIASCYQEPGGSD